MGIQLFLTSTALLAALTMGCASGQVPRGDIARAESAISQAEQRSAAESSALELRMARDKLEKARRLVEQGENRQAQMAAEQATLDAQLAAANARRVQAAESVDEMNDSLRALTEEIENE